MPLIMLHHFVLLSILFVLYHYQNLYLYHYLIMLNMLQVLVMFMLYTLLYQLYHQQHHQKNDSFHSVHFIHQFMKHLCIKFMFQNE